MYNQRRSFPAAKHNIHTHKHTTVTRTQIQHGGNKYYLNLVRNKSRCEMACRQVRQLAKRTKDTRRNSAKYTRNDGNIFVRSH